MTQRDVLSGREGQRPTADLTESSSWTLPPLPWRRRAPACPDVHPAPVLARTTATAEPNAKMPPCPRGDQSSTCHHPRAEDSRTEGGSNALNIRKILFLLVFFFSGKKKKHPKRRAQPPPDLRRVGVGPAAVSSSEPAWKTQPRSPARGSGTGEPQRRTRKNTLALRRRSREKRGDTSGSRTADAGAGSGTGILALRRPGAGRAIPGPLSHPLPQRMRRIKAFNHRKATR